MSTFIEEMANKELLRYAVQRQMFCEVTQQILDVRTAVLFMGEGITARIMMGDVWDENSEMVLAAVEERGLTPEIYDGRVLFA